MPSLNSKNQKGNGRAGIIVIKEVDNDFFVLGLRVYGSYDLPKGGVEPGEDIFKAALRETEEESGITELDFAWGLVSTNARNVKLFIAKTNEEPHIRPNPESGEYEHHGAKWLTFNQASTKLHPYLRPSIEWAKNIVLGV